jgi:archaellum component FlaC
MVDLQELTAAKIAELQSEIELHKLEASMNLFYAMMNPDKLVHVPKLARKFAKQDKMLNTELQKNYNGLDLSSNLETLLKEAKVEKELAGLKDRLSAQAQEQERAQAQIANLEKILAESKSKLEGLQHSFQALEQRYAALQQQLTAAQVHCTHARRSAHSMHKPCSDGDDGTDDTNAFAVVQMPDVRVLASRVFLADDKKTPQDAKAKAEEQAAKQRNKVEAELKSALDRLSYESMELQQVWSLINET